MLPHIVDSDTITADVIAVCGSIAVDNATADYGVSYRSLLYLVRVDAEYVLRQNDYVSKLTDFERPLVSLCKLGVCAGLRVGSDGFFNSDLLFGNPPAGIFAIDSLTSDRRVNTENGRKRRYIPIRAER